MNLLQDQLLLTHRSSFFLSLRSSDCSRECQKEHWKVHRKSCEALKDLKADLIKAAAGTASSGDRGRRHPGGDPLEVGLATAMA